MDLTVCTLFGYKVRMNKKYKVIHSLSFERGVRNSVELSHQIYSFSFKQTDIKHYIRNFFMCNFPYFFEWISEGGFDMKYPISSFLIKYPTSSFFNSNKRIVIFQ